jgi:hypothetical protein
MRIAWMKSRFVALWLVFAIVLGGCGAADLSEEIDQAPVSEQTTSEEVIAEAEPSEESEPTPESEATSESMSRGDSDANAPGGSVETSGSYVADLGFRPASDGFSFENYGGQGEVNLTPADIHRMFGDQACSTIKDGECILTPPGRQWMEQINAAMSGGHCEGMAVLSYLFYAKKLDVKEFGADTVPALELAGNEMLQREIAYWWATQTTMPARTGIVQQTPSGIVNTLMVSFEAGPEGSEQYALGFYKRDMTGGHAVTPYAVEDRGDGIYWIMVYDNNYPGEERAIVVDTNNDTWFYSGSTNPAEPADDYDGDATSFNLELAAISPRLYPQECPFCDFEEVSASGALLAAPFVQSTGQKYNEIWLEGSADLLITDMDGNSIGFRNGQFVNEIPGARTNANKFGVNVWDIDAEPVYYIPSNIDFTIAIDGTRLTEPTTSTVTMIGPGYALEVSDIVLQPGQVDELDVSPDGSYLSYRAQSSSTPFLLVAVETDQSDYLFGIYGEEMEPGEAITLSLNTKEGWLSVDSIDNTSTASYGIVVAKYDDEGEQIFGADGIEVLPDDVFYIDYLSWPGNGQPMVLEIDEGGDGSIDATIEIDDVTDEIAE